LTRRDLQQLAEKRLTEASSLFRSRLYEGSYHLAGLSIECAVKACIAKQTRRFEFPEKSKVLRSYDHNLAELVKVAGLQASLGQAVLNTAFATNWGIVAAWRIESRYTVDIKRQEASLLLSSITNPTDGVMTWLRSLW
jgi:hypothetical protein